MKKIYPTVHIVAGPNGAGKTTFALKYLKREGVSDFINADMIAAGLSPLNPASAQIQAGKLFLKLLDEKISARSNFAFETTLSGRIYFQKIEKWKRLGWKIILHFLWIPSSDFSKLRVRERVAQGGHDIPDEDIERRYSRVMENFRTLCSHCNYVNCYDNSNPIYEPVFLIENGNLTLKNASLYKKIMENFSA